MQGREVNTQRGTQYVQQCVFKTDTAYNVFDHWGDKLLNPGIYDASVEVGAYNNKLTARVVELKPVAK